MLVFSIFDTIIIYTIANKNDRGVFYLPRGTNGKMYGGKAEDVVWVKSQDHRESRGDDEESRNRVHIVGIPPLLLDC